MGIQLPRWVWIGAGSLACIAGMVNVVGFLGFEHQAVTHLTGTTSLLGAAIAQHDGRAAWHLIGVALSFVLGATVSGLIIQDSTLQLGRRYGVVLAIEAGLLGSAVPLFENGHIAGALLAAAACGLQNAMASTYSGSLIRTSHVTGLFTDVGIALGHRLRGMQIPRRRVALCLVVISAFLLGGIAGAWMFSLLGYRTLYIPAALTGVTGIAYTLYRQRQLWITKGTNGR
ncbi:MULTISPECIES: YoaK family protein [unclassified Pseudoxanthomonas]|uniref:YoaK family protein n=1 Tax=unclassified Pseudoxanthomonas TaxID=2645906 RepID=UPI003076C2A3